MIAVILPLSSFAQGVDFKELTMQEALALAGKEKKMIFIDFYTTWCGPCKMMSSEVFTQEQVGTYFNRVFVNMKVDAEKGEGVELAKKYQVRAYPTFVVLRADGTEVYRTSGARPAEEFIDKIRKGIDPKWSPEGLARRYKKGERTPELVNEYALLQMETGNIELGNQVIREYFNKLSDKKRVKPENLFLYTRYALNYRDPKADYMFAHKDRFVKENGREEVESLLYNWLRQQIMPFVAARVVSDMEVNEGEWIRLKEKIHDADLSNGKILAELEEIAEVRLKNSMKDYLDICREKFPQLEDRDCFSILVGFGVLKEQNEEIRQAAADLLQEKTGTQATVINPYYITGVDTGLLEGLKKHHSVVVTLEDGILDGGFGEKIARFYGESDVKVLNFGLKKEFLDRYNPEDVMKENHLTAEQIAEDILAVLK